MTSMVEVQKGPAGELEAKEIRTLLIKVLSSAGASEKGKKVLTGDLAIAINKMVGQYIGDDVRMEELRLPSGHIDKRVEQLDTILLRTFNRTIMRIARKEHATIGSVRDKDPFELRRIGSGTIAFIQVAFKRPQNS